jgi:hypothetical protein
VTERRGKRRFSIREAAVLLGMSEEAVTTRIRRGALSPEKTDEQVHVWLDENPDTDQNFDYPQAHLEDWPRERVEGIQELWEQVHHFRGILAEERHFRHRTDTIVVHLTRANAALASKVHELEAPAPPLRPEPAKPTKPGRTRSDSAELERVQPEREELEKPEARPTTQRPYKGPERSFAGVPEPIPGAGSNSALEDRRGDGADPRRGDLEPTRRPRSRLERRLEALERRQHRPEPISILKLLTTEEIWLALALTERAGVLPNGEVRNPETFTEATPGEHESLEHWRKLCGEPLDHLELAEELLDRMGEVYGWRSHEAARAALLLKRLELPGESSWYVGKTAEAVLNFYAVLEEHPGEGRHPKVRGAARRLKRLKELDRVAAERQTAVHGNDADEVLEAPQELPGGPRSVVKEPASGRTRSWWKRVLGG